jgi:hypothetical protein
MVTIKRKAPIREAFAGCSTNGFGVDYCDTKGHAVKTFSNVLEDYNYHFDDDDCMDLPGNDGRATIAIADSDNRPIGLAVLSWYRLPSGRYEAIGYIA